MERVQLRSINDGGLMLEKYLLAIGEAVENDCSSVAKAYLENTLFIPLPPRLRVMSVGPLLQLREDRPRRQTHGRLLALVDGQLLGMLQVSQIYH